MWGLGSLLSGAPDSYSNVKAPDDVSFRPSATRSFLRLGLEFSCNIIAK